MQIGFAAKIARKMHVASEKRTARRVGLNEGDQKITMFLAETKLDWAISPFQPRISLMRNARPCGGALHKAALLDCGRISPEKCLGDIFQRCAERLSRSGITIFFGIYFTVIAAELGLK